MIAFGGFLIAGIILVVLGLIYLAVAKGLADGNGFSRTIVAIVSVIQIAFALYQFVATNDNNTRNSALGSAIVGLIILLILFSPKANEFFGSR
jgi:heme/copper-type cytochrome/quinol oxidase subunit 4